MRVNETLQLCDDETVAGCKLFTTRVRVCHVIDEMVGSRYCEAEAPMGCVPGDTVARARPMRLSQDAFSCA
eukprot:10612220-Lingulodinium_polyedra.AAC.1